MQPVLVVLVIAGALPEHLDAVAVCGDRVQRAARGRWQSLLVLHSYTFLNRVHGLAKEVAAAHLASPTRARPARALALPRSRCVTFREDRPPDPAPDLDGVPGIGQGPEPIVHPPLAHARRG
jgi:hypothetical protein